VILPESFEKMVPKGSLLFFRALCPKGMSSGWVLLQYLEDNETLIKTILECINSGRVEDASQYQQRLQQNLMWLAGIADAQPQPPAAVCGSSLHAGCS
jgi:hypothetical protein